MTTAVSRDTDTALMAHLLRRAGFGATRDQIDEYVAKGYDETVEELSTLSIPIPKTKTCWTVTSSLLWRRGRWVPPIHRWAWRMATSTKHLEEKIAPLLAWITCSRRYQARSWA